MWKNKLKYFIKAVWSSASKFSMIKYEILVNIFYSLRFDSYQNWHKNL